MKIDKEAFKRLKQLTGYKGTDIAKKFGVSKQAIDQYKNNNSIVYQNNNRFILMLMADEKINEYKAKIQELEEFKREVKEVE